MQTREDKLIVVMVTCSSEKEALEISNLVIRKRLAACVNILSVRSIYEWEGNIENHGEHLLFIKTMKAQFDGLQETIKSVHSYQVPEIIAFDVAAASPDYAAWIRKYILKQDDTQISKGQEK